MPPKNLNKNYCSLCSQIFSRSDSLKLHVKRRHSKEYGVLYKKKETAITCNYCGNCFARHYTLKLHIKRSHEEHFNRLYPQKQKYRFSCSVCTKKFNQQHHFTYHMKTHEKTSTTEILESFDKKDKKICGVCREYGTKTITEMYTHLKNSHDIIVESENIQFTSVSEFNDWKTKFEKERATQFKKETTKSTKNHVLKIYVCNRSGKYTSHSTGQRSLKLQGTKKINAFCPCSIKLLIQTDGKCTVKLIKTHVGHQNELAHMTLTKPERDNIVKKIAQKIPFNHILDEIRETVVNSDVHRVHLCTKKDLFNIENSYNLGHPPTWHKNDAISVEAWANSMKNHGDCVVFYKPQKSSCQEYPQIKEDDFILIIMTPSQVDILQKYGQNIICVDGTHGTNNYNFELHTILVVDELLEGFPCAFLISNRSDQVMMDIFFSEIKKIVGIVKCSTFMSDMAEVYFNSWLETMETPERRLYCTWHVDKAWRKNINSKIASKELRALVYKQLRVILQERDLSAFDRMIMTFIESHSQDPSMSDFLKYFDQYLKKPTTWAYCHRKHAKINTNMRLERLHRTIKYEYLNGKKVKRLDKTLTALMKLVRDKLFQKVIAGHKGKLCSSISNIRSRHKHSEILDVGLVTKSEDVFIIQSSCSTELYYIHKDVETCNCQLRCNDCQICIHNFYCSCIDSSIKFNMCKHIHLIAQFLLKEANNDTLQSINDEDEPTLIINENDWLDSLGIILEEISAKDVFVNDLQNRQEKLIEQVSSLIRGTKSIEAIKSLETIVSSMAPVVAAVENNDAVTSFISNGDSSSGKIVTQRKLFSTKKKKTIKNNNSLCTPNAPEAEKIVLNLLLEQ